MPMDLNQLARTMVAKAAHHTSLVRDTSAASFLELAGPKNAAAVALGRKGGLRGGKIRAEKMTREQRSASAKKAARARWSDGERRRAPPQAMTPHAARPA